jgi:putative ABC transport system permease protein
VIDNADEIMKVIKKDKRVDVVTPRLRVWGMINTMEGKSQTISLRGIVPDNEALINTFITNKTGKELTNRAAYEIEIGGVLAEEIGLQVGDNCVITTVSADGYQSALYVTLSGIISSFNEEFDSILVKAPLSVVQELLNLYSVQEIVILLNKTENTYSYLKDLKEIIKEKGWDLKVTTWDEQAGYYRQVVSFYGSYFRIILLIICIVVLFTIFNNMIMSVYERVTEIGTIRSFGVERKSVFILFFLEAFVIGVIGCIIGLLVAFGLIAIINIVGVTIPKPPGTTSDINATILITFNNILIAVIITIVVPLLASIIPTIKITKMKIIDQILYNAK